MSLLRTTFSRLPKRAHIPKQTSTVDLCCIRSFHSSLPPLKAKAPRSPRVKSTKQAPPSTTITRDSNFSQVGKTYDVEEFLPPKSLLKTTRDDGDLEVEPENALEFLREFSAQIHAGGRNGGLEERLCAKHSITPLALFQLSTAIFTANPTSAPTPAQTHLAKSLMIASYAQNCPLALYTIIYTALQNQTPISRSSEPLQHLKSLAASDDAEPIAMTLLGLALRSQRKEREALGWFLKAVGWKEAEPEDGEGSEHQQYQQQEGLNVAFEGANEALLAIGEIFEKSSPHYLPAAEEAFRVAAIELDDPQAYYRLATLLPVGDGKRDGYLAKAGASGVGEAFRELARTGAGEGNGNGGGSKEVSGMDREWALLAEEYTRVNAVKGRAST